MPPKVLFWRHMDRTTIMIPAELKRKASELARLNEISLGELTRRALKAAIEQAQRRDQRDSLLTDRTTFKGKTGRDLAANHDSYLYGD
jgi:hypothetical protein